MWRHLMERLEFCKTNQFYQKKRKGVRFYLATTGDTRVVERFAFLPVVCNGEVRWLERVVYHQSYYEGWHNDYFMN